MKRLGVERVRVKGVAGIGRRLYGSGLSLLTRLYLFSFSLKFT